MYDVDNQLDLNRNENPNWQFIGKLKDVSVITQDEKTFTWIKTNTTFFVVEGLLMEPVHVGQTVKLSKRDNAAKIGSLLVYRPNQDNEALEEVYS